MSLRGLIVALFLGASPAAAQDVGQLLSRTLGEGAVQLS